MGNHNHSADCVDSLWLLARSLSCSHFSAETCRLNRAGAEVGQVIMDLGTYIVLCDHAFVVMIM